MPFRNVVRQSRNSKLATIMTTNYCLYSTCIGIIMVVGCDLRKANSFIELHAVSVLLIVEFPVYCTSSLLSKVCLARCLGCIFTPPTHCWEQKLASCNLSKGSTALSHRCSTSVRSVVLLGYSGDLVN